MVLAAILSIALLNTIDVQYTDAATRDNFADCDGASPVRCLSGNL
jgi:hypothetical protein